VAGTYGLKQERYDVAIRVGAPLFAQAKASGCEVVVTDSETCRWWIERHAGIPALHPIEILAAALGIEDLRPARPLTRR
jgi:glycerol-3-phosphate dehydrogenase subunit C